MFHDLSGLDTAPPEAGRRLNPGSSNIDHVVLNWKGWLILDAKNVLPGKLRVENGRGVVHLGRARSATWSARPD